MIESMKSPDASSASIADAAADWVARRDAGALSRDEERRLAGWLADDPRHHGAYVRAHAAWTLAGRTTSTVKRSAPRLDRRAAALILATIAGGGGLFGLARWRGSATRVATQRGEILRAPLRDGSLAVVNTDSRLAFDIGERRRTVRMSRGEAWFDVAKDPARPFTVALGYVRVQAVGTAFSVRVFETGVEVVVTEGVVALWNVRSDRKLVSLRAGERAFSPSEPLEAPTVSQIGEARAQRLLAWKDGLIVLEDRTVAEAVAEFNRYNDLKLVVEDDRLGDRRLVGAFQANDPQSFVRALSNILAVRSEERHGEIWLSAS